MKALIFALAMSSAIPAMADTKSFRDIIGDAANIQMDAEALRDKLKDKVLDELAVKQEVAALSKHIDSLKMDVDTLDSHLQDLSPQQRKDWELAKTKVQLLDIFADWKQSLIEAGDLNKNRNLLRSHADGIAVRAALLQRTVNRLDR